MILYTQCRYVGGGCMLTGNKHFRCNEEEWQLFKLLCKRRGSNASIEIRRFINRFNEK